MQSPFRVEVRSDERATVLAVSGELDLASSPSLESELELVFAADNSDLVILDLSELEFMDSTGLSVLVRAHQRAQESGHGFAVIKGGPQVQRLLSLTGVSDRMQFADSLEELFDGG
ncbi:MAG: STAS domain-containing protein [Solirubrobacterales bacterium]|nr:STAS domain-containing protein [Solirubrobacterales bacterium]